WGFTAAPPGLRHNNSVPGPRSRGCTHGHSLSPLRGWPLTDRGALRALDVPPAVIRVAGGEGVVVSRTFTPRNVSPGRRAVMLRRWARWVRTRPKRTAFLLLAAALLALNVVAYLHAWSMTHFTRGGAKTLGAERLSALGKVAVLLTGVHVPKPANDATP